MRPSVAAVVVLSGIAAAPVAAGVLWLAPPKAQAAAAATAWTVDKANSRIRFRSSFAGMGFEGGFSRWDARINFDPKNLAGSRAVVTIDLASVNSGDADRDQTLPTAEWFDVKKTPQATFTSTSFRDLGGGRYQASGNLTLKGVTRPVSFPFTLAIQGTTARVTGQATLNRSQFKVGQGQFAGADTIPYEVVVPINLVAKRAG